MHNTIGLYHSVNLVFFPYLLKHNFLINNKIQPKKNTHIFSPLSYISFYIVYIFLNYATKAFDCTFFSFLFCGVSTTEFIFHLLF